MNVHVADLSWRASIRMTGKDRLRFLHGMCTNDIKRLAPGQGCMAAIVNRQGKMQADIAVHATPDSLLVVVDRSNLQPTLDALSRFLVADDVKMEAPGLSAVGLYGVGAAEMLESEPLSPFHVSLKDELMITGDPTLGLEGYAAWVPQDRKAELIERLRARGAAPMGEAGIEALRIENGFPRWGADMGPDVLPMEAGLEPIAISYTKGCYIGQEVIQRVKTYSEPPRMLVQIRLLGNDFRDPLPPVPASISVAGTEIGRAGSIGVSPLSGASYALGLVRKEYKQPGTKVEVAGISGLVGSLPWHERTI